MPRRIPASNWKARRRFPQLPDGLEYRFANRDLVLWDSHADLILDIIPNAIPRFTDAQP